MRHLLGNGTGHRGRRLGSVLEVAIDRHKLSIHDEICQSLYIGFHF